MARLQVGDKIAFSMLYDNYSAAIYGIILRIVRCEQSAQDITQDTFVKVWSAFPSYDSTRGRLFTWLLNIARHNAIDTVRSPHYRQSKSTHGVDEGTYCEGHVACKALNPECIGIEELVSALKPEQRQIIDMMYFGGYTQSETAENLGLPLGTVKTRTRSAMKALKRLFATSI
ncbi:DNA-directed RNA polymerase sigma-70 factor [Pontibacter akesuensis]|nr:DNA-directed RNA polymerase sigma-70 factor [Pontibacter akesuensis]